MYYIQPYFKDLFNAVFELYSEQREKKKFKQFFCFRGGNMSEDEIHYFKANDVVQNLGFLSTSLSKEEALEYSANAFFEIHVCENSERDPK